LRRKRLMVFLLTLLVPMLTGLAVAQGFESGALKIPQQTVSFDVNGQPVAITAWGEVTRDPSGAIRLGLTADLNDLAKNITPLLGTELNRSDRCGERISVESAQLAPASPAANLTVNLHYERWACAKVLGKQVVKRLVGGNGVVIARLTPSAGENGIAVNAAVEKIDADGSLGDLLHSGSLGTSIQEKIAHSIESAIRKAANFNSLLPPAVAGLVRIRGIQFTEGQEGRLWLDLRAEANITADQFQALASQLRR
jgi:hypothetical protein